jgi:hypothetical protein
MALAVATAAVALLAAPGCGGTLEGKYRRGELTSTTTAPRARATGATTPSTGSPPAGTPASSPASPSTTTTASTSGNAAAGAARGEREGRKPDGTIDGSAAWRAVVQPSSGGRHR